MIQAPPSQNRPAYNSLGNVVVEPGQKVNFFVGFYEDALPQPRLNLDFGPEHTGSISASLTRHNNMGDYTLVYELENNGEAACRVVISAAWPE